MSWWARREAEHVLYMLRDALAEAERGGYSAGFAEALIREAMERMAALQRSLSGRFGSARTLPPEYKAFSCIAEARDRAEVALGLLEAYVDTGFKNEELLNQACSFLREAVSSMERAISALPPSDPRAILGRVKELIEEGIEAAKLGAASIAMARADEGARLLRRLLSESGWLLARPVRERLIAALMMLQGASTGGSREELEKALREINRALASI